MGEKYYKPILNEGDHLVKSKENEGRFRGVSQDANNKTTDIVEWEEYELEDSYEYSSSEYESGQVELTPEQQLLAEAIGEAIATVVIYGAEQLNKRFIQPWWNNKAKPWIGNRIADIKWFFSGKTRAEEILEERNNKLNEDKSSENSNNIVLNNTKNDSVIDELLDEEFKSIQIEMNSEEAKSHIMKLIYHMLGTAYEIKILSNAVIVDQLKDKTNKIEKQKEAEHLLAEKVANYINMILSDEDLLLDVNTSKQLFGLFGGGVKLNGEYVPVEVEKVAIAIDSTNKDNKN